MMKQLYFVPMRKHVWLLMVLLFLFGAALMENPQ